MTTKAPIYDIETGPLAETYGLFVPSTINTGAEISVDRIADPTLRDIWFYTANLPLATKRDGRLLLGMGGRTAFNAVFGKDTARGCQELVDTGYIHLSPEQRDVMLQLERAGEVTFVNPKDLRLDEKEAEYCPFPIRTGAYEKDVTPARMPFVNAGYGSGDQLRQVMDNLKVNGKIAETTVFTMSPDHAAENVRDDQMVARASRLSNSGGSSGFGADYRGVDGLNALRGVRQVVVVPWRVGGELLQVDGDAKKTSLEDLAGKGSVAHGNLAVVRQDDVSPEAWLLLTQKQ